MYRRQLPSVSAMQRIDVHSASGSAQTCHNYIVMAYIVMAYVAIAYVAMAYIVMGIDVHSAGGIAQTCLDLSKSPLCGCP